MQITFMEGDRPLTKHYYLNENGNLAKKSYRNALYFSSYTHDINDIRELFPYFVEHAKLNHALVGGNPPRPFVKERRTNAIDNKTPTQLIRIDVDGVNGIENIEEYVQRVLPEPFHNTTYIAQYSASMGVEPDKGLSAHIIMLATDPVTQGTLDSWFRSLNLTQPDLVAALTLDRSNSNLKWPMDVALKSSAHLMYIAPPLLEDGVEDHFQGERIQLVEKEHDWLDYTFVEDLQPDLDNLKKQRINELRVAAGLPRKQNLGTKIYKSVTVAKGVGQRVITSEMREERGFVYFNLDGGDSWGYYHPVNDPSIIYNFKGEDPFATREVLPDYYAEATQAAEENRREQIAELNNEEGFVYDVFVDATTDEFYRIEYNPETKEVYYTRSKSLWAAQNFLNFHGQAVPEVFTPRDVYFDPTTSERYSPDGLDFNTFSVQPSTWNVELQTALPELTHRVILHAVGGCEETLTHFLNWLAYIFQTRKKTKTAWVLHGTEGTGKGTIFERIIQPVFGLQHAIRWPFSRILSNDKNGGLERAVFVLIDEMEAGGKKNAEAEGRLRDIITEDTHDIRRMREDTYTVQSYTNVLIFGNKRHTINIPTGDRRFNIAPRQEERLMLSTYEREVKIKEELPATLGYLMHLAVDENAVKQVIHNDDRERMQLASMNNSEGVIEHIARGNFTFLWENRPDIDFTHEQDVLSHQSGNVYLSYGACLEEIWRNRQQGSITRNALHSLLVHLAGSFHNTTATAFAQWVNGNTPLEIKRTRIDGRTQAGVRLARPWEVNSALETEVEEWLEQRQRAQRDGNGNVIPMEKRR